MSFKRRQIVADGRGNYFAVDRVTPVALELHSVNTKESWVLPIDYAFLTLTVVEGLVEA